MQAVRFVFFNVSKCDWNGQLLIEFPFDKPALTAADGDTDAERVATQQVDGAEGGIAKREVEYRASFAHRQRHADTAAPFVELVVAVVDKVE